MITLLRNVNVVGYNAVLYRQCVVFSERVLYIGDGANMPHKPDMEIDGRGFTLSPGFIDLHTHGIDGIDISDGGGSVAEVSTHIVMHGVTSFLPAVSGAEALSAVRECGNTRFGANILGAHLEGPYLNPKRRGAYPEKLLCAPSTALIDEFSDIIRIVTLAPELEGSDALISFCSKKMIRCSIGHTDAAYGVCIKALKAGASSFTHIFRDMPPLLRLEPGAAGAALDTSAFCELTADEKLIAPTLMRLIYRLKGPDRLYLASDSLATNGEGMPFSFHGSGGVVKDGLALFSDGSPPGSTLTLNAALRNLQAVVKAPLYELVRTVSSTPAAFLGLSRIKGRLEPGYDADMCLLDENMTPLISFVGGRIAYALNRFLD